MTRRTFVCVTAGTAAWGVAGISSARNAPSNATASGQREPAVLLHGDFPDPTIVRDGRDFYMTHSYADARTPGLLIWHSTDLYRWKPMGHALRRNLGAVAAPELVKYKDLFYLYFPARRTNWVITAKSPAGPWSEPIDLKVGDIDPGHVVGPDGTRYLYLSGGNVVQLAADGLSIVGSRRAVYAGWRFPESWLVECFCLESPKLTFRNGYYYLTSAEGGTTGPDTSHMIVSARSRSPLGPWDNSPYNPIVHTWKPREEWWSKGHGTLVDDGRDNWYVVYHAYEHDCRELGRQTLIEPITWTSDGWFKSRYASGVDFHPRIIPNYVVEPDDFSGPELKPQWSFAGLESSSDYKLGSGSVLLQGSPDRMRTMQCLAADYSYEVSTKLEADGDSEIGLVLFYESNAYAGIGKKGDKIFDFRIGKAFGPAVEVPHFRYLKLRLFKNDLATFYSADGRAWQKTQQGMNVSGYQSSALGGFSSLKIALFIKGAGTLRVSNFEYRVL